MPTINYDELLTRLGVDRNKQPVIQTPTSFLGQVGESISQGLGEEAALVQQIRAKAAAIREQRAEMERQYQQRLKEKQVDFQNQQILEAQKGKRESDEAIKQREFEGLEKEKDRKEKEKDRQLSWAEALLAANKADAGYKASDIISVKTQFDKDIID